ncbi:MAG: hypothetical protein GY810_28420 [Aureispira sp.]|nr:hypothetical protein [Aureispira sp.]
MKGKADKAGPDRIKFVNGINTFRLVGDMLPMYVYWVPLADGSGSVPVECLGFNRDIEKFENKEKDWVRELFPDMKCSWSYKSLCIDREDGKVKAVDHKKKLLQAIVSFAKKFGDPTDQDKGWDIVASRAKTGPAAFNVEYSLEFGDIQVSALTDAEKVLVVEAGSLDEMFPRPTPEAQEKFLKEKCLGTEDEDEDEIPEELVGGRAPALTKEQIEAEDARNDDIPF